MPDMTRTEVAAVQEMNRGRRHQQLKNDYKITIKSYIERCTVQSLEKIVKLIEKEERNNYEHNKT
jgi:hypothetical protein